MDGRGSLLIAPPDTAAAAAAPALAAGPNDGREFMADPDTGPKVVRRDMADVGRATQTDSDFLNSTAGF